MPDQAPPYTGAVAPPGDAEPVCDGCGNGGRLIACYWGETLCSSCGAAVEAQFDREGWPRAPWEVPPVPGVMVLGAGYALCGPEMRTAVPA